MTVRLNPDGSVGLAGVCPSEDAEMLLQHLLRDPAVTVDWRSCEGAHTAVVQVLMAAHPKLLGPPADRRLASWVHPVIAGADTDTIGV